MPTIPVTPDARVTRPQASVLVVLAAVLAGLAALSANHPEQLAGRVQPISAGSNHPVNNALW
jgi:hypothetical protein